MSNADETAQMSAIQLSAHSELVRKSVSGFSLAEEMIGAINNYEWTQRALKSQTEADQTLQSYLWTALSNVVGGKPTLMAGDFQREIEESIINFIDNISDIDTCHVKSLQSMVQMLGLSYNVFNKLKLMPLTVCKLIDVLSIKRELLLRPGKVDSLMAELLSCSVMAASNKPKDEDLDRLSEARQSSVISSLSTDSFGESCIISTELSGMLDRVQMQRQPAISGDLLHQTTVGIFANVLSSFCEMTYCNEYATVISEMSDSYMYDDFSVDNNNQKELDDLQMYRLRYNIPKSFNAIAEANLIEQGESSLDSYTSHERYLVEAELEYRRRPRAALKMESRYHYYREREVRDYFKFIESECATALSDLYMTAAQYKADTTYIQINNVNDTKKLLENGVIQADMVWQTAETLASIVEAIRDIREQLKTQVQKNFMKGTKQHLEYVIREYIRMNVYEMAKKLFISGISAYELSDVTVSINEYIDPTEYFNISAAVDKASDSVNPRYWQTPMAVRNIAGFNDNSLWRSPDIALGGCNTTFTDDDISSFYLHILNTKIETGKLSSGEAEQAEHVHKLLSAVFDSAADPTYASGGAICCDLDFGAVEIQDLPKGAYSTVMSNVAALQKQLSGDLSDNWLVEDSVALLSQLQGSSMSTDFGELTMDVYANMLHSANEQLQSAGKQLSDIGVQASLSGNDDSGWRAYKEKLFRKYSGDNLGWSSFANIKNKRHPSYQVHPYIKNFADYDASKYPIPDVCNMPAGSTARDFVKCRASEFIGADGKQVSSWHNPLNTNTDYLTHYEKSSNRTELGTVVQQAAYEGFACPGFDRSTVDNLSSCSALSSSKFYKHLNLSNYDLSCICHQLSAHKDAIKNILTSDSITIHRYGKDFYGSQYFLLKNKNQPSAPGQMWMKLKDHPVALPMAVFVDTVLDESKSQISLIDDKLKDLLSVPLSNYVSDISVDGKCLHTVNVLDFTISDDKSELLLIANKENNLFGVHCNVKKQSWQDKDQSGVKYYLVKDMYNIDANGNPDIDYSFNMFSDWDICRYYSYDNCVGVVQTKHAGDKLSVYMPFWDKYKLHTVDKAEYTKLSTEINLSGYNQNTTIKVDVADNTKLLTVAYLKNSVPNAQQLSNWAGSRFTYGSSIDGLNMLSSGPTLMTMDYSFAGLRLSHMKTKEHLLYNDMGFIPLHRPDASQNVQISIAGTKFSDDLSAGAILKFNLAGDANNGNGIDFKRILPVRLVEQYKSNKNNDDHASYTDARYSEHDLASELSISPRVYDMHELELAYGSDLEMHVDEGYIQDLLSAGTSKEFVDRYGDIPVLYVVNNNIEDKYRYPSSEKGTQVSTIGHVELQLNSTDKLSVQWFKKHDGFKLDFNAQLYNNENEAGGRSYDNNCYNFKHSFLNLDRPGDAGCLQLWDGADYKNVYYIKNISRKSKPKFELMDVTSKVHKPEPSVELGVRLDALYTEDTTFSSNNKQIGSVPVANEYKYGIGQLVADRWQ